jgi:hypothetical protein
MQFHAELALGEGEERLTADEQASIVNGRSFEVIFDGAARVRPLP